jgi:hypothetical protein
MGFLSTGSTFASAVQTLIGLLNMIVGVLVALAVVVLGSFDTLKTLQTQKATKREESALYGVWWRCLYCFPYGGYSLL